MRLAELKFLFRKRGSTTTTRVPLRELANPEDPAPEVKSGERDAAALAELAAPEDAPPSVPIKVAPVEADPDELAPDAAPVGDAAPEVITPDDAPEEATPNVPAEATGEVAPEEAIPEEVPAEAAPDDVPVVDVLAPRLGFNTITGLLCAEAAELAEDEEDTSGEAIGPRLFAAEPVCLLDDDTTALTLFKDVKACGEKIELRDGTLNAVTAFPVVPVDRGLTEPGLILSIEPELAVEAARAPARPGLAPADAPDADAEAAEFADAPEAAVELGLTIAEAPEVAPVFTPNPAWLKLKPIWFR